MSMTLTSPVAKTVFLAVCLLVAAFLFVSASAEYFAFVFSQKGDLKNLRLAVRLQPGSAEYQYELGRLLTQANRLQDAAEAFTKAANLNPNESGYWLKLAAADNRLGHPIDQRHALEQAIAADPTDSKVAWEAGSTYLAEKDFDSAFKEFKTALEADPSLSGTVIPLVWYARPDVDILLRDVMPAGPGVYSSFLGFLISKEESESAAKVWKQIVKLGQPARLSDVFDYVRYLVGRGQPTEARLVWQQAGPLCDLRQYQSSADNLVVNGDFGLNVLNGGFDWHYQKPQDVALALDPTEPHSGSRSLLISYDSRGLQDSGIYQMISVEPGASYQFSAYFKTQALEGAGGPHFLLQDFYSQQSSFESEELKDAASWQETKGEFKTSPATKLLVLRIERVPGGSPIRGKLWIGGVRLHPTQGSGL